MLRSGSERLELKCNLCGKKQSLDQFSKAARRGGGHQICKVCVLSKASYIYTRASPHGANFVQDCDEVPKSTRSRALSKISNERLYTKSERDYKLYIK